MGELEKPSQREMAVSAIGAGLATLLGFVAAPAGPEVAATAGMMLTPYTTQLVQRAADEWRRKSEVVAETALAASGIADPEEFCAKLSGDPDLIALAQKILWAASVSGNEHKLRTLGQLLGGAVGDRGDRLDEAQILAAALAELEPPHVVVLEVLTETAPDPKKTWEGAWFNSGQVRIRVPLDPEFVQACLNALTRHGLAMAITDNQGTERYGLTKLGRAMADVMRKANSSQPGED